MSESLWSPTPGPDPFQTIQKSVCGYVLMPDDHEALDVAAQGIRRAIDRLNTRTWAWLMIPETITFEAGVQEYGLEAAFKAPLNLSLRDTSTKDVGRLRYLSWGSFLKELQWGQEGNPSYYSVANSNAFGVLRLDANPSASFVGSYPTGQLWYYRKVQYPGAAGTAVDVPSECVEYIQAFAEGYTAGRYAVDKSFDAYRRAKEMFDPEKNTGALIRSDNEAVQSDWE